MTDVEQMMSTVEVAVDPATAFDVFTQEVGCWWLQGPINFHNVSKTWEMRIEPGVGGRVLEVHDQATGDGYELAVITAWEPAVRLAWRSSIDAVDIEVAFAATAVGTQVTVTGQLRDGGQDLGGSAWLRMTQVWLPRWLQRRSDTPHQPVRLARLGVALFYNQPVKMGRWLRDTFQFDLASDLPESESDHHGWTEFHVGDASLILMKRLGGDGGGDGGQDGGEQAPEESATHTPWIFVDDIHATYQAAQDGGARIVDELTEHGSIMFTAADPEGYQWTFAQASPVQRAG